jgi:hypothetical protein
VSHTSTDVSGIACSNLLWNIGQYLPDNTAQAPEGSHLHRATSPHFSLTLPALFPRFQQIRTKTKWQTTCKTFYISNLLRACYICPAHLFTDLMLLIIFH